MSLSIGCHLQSTDHRKNNTTGFTHLIEFSLSVEELGDSTDEFWIHEQSFTVSEQKWRQRRRFRYYMYRTWRRLRASLIVLVSYRAFRMSHFSLKYLQARFRPWGFRPTWMMTSITSCSGTRSEVRDRFSSLGDTKNRTGRLECGCTESTWRADRFHIC